MHVHECNRKLDAFLRKEALPFFGIKLLRTWVAFAQPDHVTGEISQGYAAAVQTCQKCMEYKGNSYGSWKSIYYMRKRLVQGYRVKPSGY